MQYDLSHLTHVDDNVGGPIQDDEALLMYAVIRCMRLKTVIEIGGLAGYSATNFLAAVGATGHVTTIDIQHVPQLADNHRVVVCPVGELDPAQLSPCDFVFFDCHDYDGQVAFFDRAVRARIIGAQTIIALHDTGLHPTAVFPWAYKIVGGWVHQPAERRLVNYLRSLGYCSFCAHADDKVPHRHGLTLMQRPLTLEV